MGPAMVTATLANCNFASPAMFTLIAEVRNEPTEAAKREAPAQVEVRYWHLADIPTGTSNVRFWG
jgi:hypothetical protein